MRLHHLLADSARRTPDAVAVISGGRHFTYRELDLAANRAARLLQLHGVQRGDRVVIALENGFEMLSAYFGALKSGATAVPMAAGPRSDRLAHCVTECEPKVALIDAATARAIKSQQLAISGPQWFVVDPDDKGREGAFTDWAGAWSHCSDEPIVDRTVDLDLAAIIYTSGSTGEPRGVMLTHRNLVTNARSIVSYLRLTAADSVMCVLPFHYVYGLSLVHTHMAVGGSIVIENRSVFPNVVLAGMVEHRVTGFSGVPSTFTLMLHRSNLSATALPHLRYVTVAGGALSPSRIKEWLRHVPNAEFFVMYGATEAAARLSYLSPADLARKPGSIGRAIPNVELLVINESGGRATAGEIGELVARGSNISCGYWRNPEETALRFSALGYRTGDLAYADEDGFLFLVGRQHDMLKIGANRVGTKEIEDVLHAHAAVYEATVVGVPHDVLGEVPIAFVSLKVAIGDPQNTLRGFCATHLAPYKVPARVVALDELPKLPGTGKLDRVKLRALAAELRVELVS
jgi:long-chain acyl-CoA synthetase